MVRDSEKSARSRWIYEWLFSFGNGVLMRRAEVSTERVGIYSFTSLQCPDKASLYQYASGVGHL